MKKIVLMTGILMSVSSAAMAERQTYSRYPTSTFATDPAIQQAQQQQAPQSYEEPNTYRTYPGREQYGEHFGAIPRHPGDYKDAVDRGSWTGGGSVGARSFDIR